MLCTFGEEKLQLHNLLQADRGIHLLKTRALRQPRIVSDLDFLLLAAQARRYLQNFCPRRFPRRGQIPVGFHNVAETPIQGYSVLNPL